MVFTCKSCGITSKKKGRKHVFCSTKCYAKSRIKHEQVLKICNYCKREYLPKRSGNWRNSKYCSLKCARLNRKGTKTNQPPDWYEKYKANPGGGTKGRPKTEEHKRKLSLAHMGKKCPWNTERNRKWGGENHPFWRNGISKVNARIRNSKEFQDWRRAVLLRDNNTCVKCGSTKDIGVDHIKPFALFLELRFDVANGQTLCKSCHKVKTITDMKEIKKLWLKK